MSGSLLVPLTTIMRAAAASLARPAAARHMGRGDTAGTPANRRRAQCRGHADGLKLPPCRRSGSGTTREAVGVGSRRPLRAVHHLAGPCRRPPGHAVRPAGARPPDQALQALPGGCAAAAGSRHSGGAWCCRSGRFCGRGAIHRHPCPKHGTHGRPPGQPAGRGPAQRICRPKAQVRTHAGVAAAWRPGGLPRRLAGSRVLRSMHALCVCQPQRVYASRCTTLPMPQLPSWLLTTTLITLLPASWSCGRRGAG